jgi:hypothetical protein
LRLETCHPVSSTVPLPDAHSIPASGLLATL